MKIIIKVSTILSLLVVVTGCLNPQQIRQQQVETCLGYGFRAGTNQFNQCMTRQAEKAERADACSGAYLRGAAQANPTDSFWIQQAAGRDAEAACMAGNMPKNKRPADPPPQNVTPRNTSCTSAGNSINCITY
jgi:hypothetical protein